MAKRELQIPINNILDNNSKEELIFKSPSTIPDKGIRNLIATKKILGSNCSYYDISPTENQTIDYLKDIEQIHHNIAGYTNEEGIVKMGEFEDI